MRNAFDGKRTREKRVTTFAFLHLISGYISGPRAIGWSNAGTQLKATTVEIFSLKVEISPTNYISSHESHLIAIYHVNEKTGKGIPNCLFLLLCNKASMSNSMGLTKSVWKDNNSFCNLTSLLCKVF